MEIDHVTIRTRDITGTRDFFITVFGLVEGERPKAIQRIPGCWLFDGGRPIVHIIGSAGNGRDRAAETIDHVGFRRDDYAAFRAKLDGLRIPYSLMDLEDIQERRIFLQTPSDVLLEVVFAEPVPASVSGIA